MADDNQKNADFIGRVVSDPKNPPETRMLTGWFGESGEEGYRRLYTDAELTNYIDIPDDAILYTEPLRDVQPAGCVLVWIKRDAALKPGGSASSRAARFLQGQVQQDFASAGAAGSLEKAGLRCATDVPCGEPTGFTGQCTKQPEVGGAWPCITAIPHCLEVTGFTGKCTHAPWPNPTRYFGCTQLHCPTNDLTHIPHICNIVASGQPGCVVINPPQGGETGLKADAAEADEKAIPETSIPGCGYTKTWGVCETHLLGCGQTNPLKCAVSIDIPCITQTERPDCFAGGAPEAAFYPNTRMYPVCYPTEVCTKHPQCFGDAAQVAGGAQFKLAPSRPPICPSGFVCPKQTLVTCAVCNIQRQAPVNPSWVDACPTRLGCETKPVTTLCTQIQEACETKAPEWCPDTSCGPNCQTQQVGGCPPTQFGPPCPTPMLDCTFGCTQTGTGCPVTNPLVVCANPNAQAFAARAAAPRPAPLTQVGCPASDFVACSQFGGCPTLPKGDCTLFNCPSLPQQFAAAGAGGGCTQSGPLCHTYPRGDCTFFGCPSPGIDCTVVVCTHFGPQCPPHPSLQGQLCPITVGSPQCPPPRSLQGQLCPITTGGPQCPPVSGGFQCPSALCQSIACQSIACQPGGGGQQEFAAARAAAGGGGGIGVTAWLDCTQFGAYCPPFFTQFEQQCVVQPIFTFDPQCLTPPPPTPACPTAHCPPHSHQFVVCTAFGPQCHRTVVEARAAQQGVGIHPTPATHCFVCDRQAAAAVPHTQVIIQCNPSLIDACPTRLIIQCNPSVIDACPTRLCTHQIIQCHPSVVDACPTRIGCPTQNPLQCPPHSGFNCPSQLGCQSIACQSAACQPGGGGQQQFAPRAVGAMQTFVASICTQFGAQCGCNL